MEPETAGVLALVGITLISKASRASGSAPVPRRPQIVLWDEVDQPAPEMGPAKPRILPKNLK
jgi:hypothetical protein